jgi:hypothetical protein
MVLFLQHIYYLNPIVCNILLKECSPTPAPKRELFLSSRAEIYYTSDNFLFSIEVSDFSSNHARIKIIKECIYFIFSRLSFQMFCTISSDKSQQ